MIPLIWAIAGVVLVVAEVLSGELVLAMLGAAALDTAGASALGVPLGPDLAVFAVLSGLLVLLVRPAVNRRLRVHESVNTGTRGLLGAQAEVVEAITSRTGTVRIRGALWSARALHDDELAAGTAVMVVEISGATAVVTAADPGRG